MTKKYHYEFHSSSSNGVNHPCRVNGFVFAPSYIDAMCELHSFYEDEYDNMDRIYLELIDASEPTVVEEYCIYEEE